MTKDNDNGRQFHITLNSYDRKALEFMKAQHGTSLSGAIRVSIRAAARSLGFKYAPLDGTDIQEL